MKTFLVRSLLLCAATLLITGCVEQVENPPVAQNVDTTNTSAPAFAGKKLCLACGAAYAKDAEHTCSTHSEQCAHCELHKGTALCCKHITSDDPNAKAICGSCGQIAGSDVCCKEGAEVCTKCGLHKGSPACCKLDHKHDDDDGRAHENGDGPDHAK